jgi:hypothetical protein
LIHRCKFDEVIGILSADPQAKGIDRLRDILGRPVRPAGIGHHDTQSIRAVRLELHGRLQPAIGREPDDQSTLIVLIDRVESKLGRQDEVGSISLAEQTMRVVDAKTVVRPLP